MDAREQRRPVVFPFRFQATAIFRQRPEVRFELLLGVQHERTGCQQLGLRLPDPILNHFLISEQGTNAPRRLFLRKLDKRIERSATDAERYRRLVVNGMRRVAVGGIVPDLAWRKRPARQQVFRRHVAVDHAHVVAAGAPHAGRIPGVDDLELTSRHHERCLCCRLTGGLVDGHGANQKVPRRVVAAAGEPTLIVDLPASAIRPDPASGIGPVGGAMAGADQRIPVVEDLAGERRFHAPDDQRVDLRGNLHAPPHRSVDRRDGLDDLDLVSGLEVLATQLSGQGIAVQSLIGNRPGCPLREPTQSLGLVPRRLERFLQSCNSLQNGRLFDLVPALENFRSYQLHPASWQSRWSHRRGRQAS